ncbi:TorD/DmsD family molecular chaperone [Roseibaca sp. Y0-43]|uniref:TorD/DmsD family molecular chaperone n=1 Tax=Roseibaca sp. Y0-43 TaxID=2816854 RepID=UPI001D0C1077|nr:molecular chaperone TorD family protein [Roseibaca sp. Y0-43]MCC1481659.1 molecular chaperone TorD family protein [Roseibaca sp. Y0-43]
MTDSQPGSGPAIEEFDQARSEQYRFLARLLAAPPSAEMLQQIAQLQGDDSPLGHAFANLARAAAGADAKAVEREFFELFIGVGRGELLPYASFYQTGFLNERPLADLRGDLATLGVARAEGRHEPEDHIALLFEVMADFAAGEIVADEKTQAQFHARHVQPWAVQFFDDLAVAPSVAFYRPVAEIGRILTEIETRAFALAA